MNQTPDCVAIIPCLNEAKTVGELVRAVRIFLPTVIVVDDGSTDGTAIEAAQAGAEVIRHSQNRGKGTALQAGFKRARSRGFSRALTLDGDGQHHPADIPALLERANESGAALVIGNRLAAAGAIPWLRRNVNRWMSGRISKLAGLPLADSQCGMRLVNLDAWSDLQLKTEHFEFESELLVEFIKAGHKVEFVPVQVIYNSGRTHIRPLVDSWRWFRWWFAQLHARNARLSVLPSWMWRSLARLQHNPRSVGQFHAHTLQPGLDGETTEFPPAKPAFD
jgi:glycosyltransferase involved in cell wall biosynthesis